MASSSTPHSPGGSIILLHDSGSADPGEPGWPWWGEKVIVSSSVLTKCRVAHCTTGGKATCFGWGGQ